MSKKNNELKKIESNINLSNCNIQDWILGLFKNPTARELILGSLKSFIPDITFGVFKPLDWYYDPNTNENVIKFEINTSSNVYDVSVNIQYTKKHGKYKLHVYSTKSHISYGFCFEVNKEERKELEE